MHCKNNGILFFLDAFSFRQSRVGWFKCSCGGGRDQLRGHPMSFFGFGTPGKSGGHTVGVTGSGGKGGQRMSPRKVQGARPLYCAGVKLLCTRHHRGHARREREREGGKKGSAEIAQGPASSLLVHLSTLETHCVWQSKLGIRPTSKAENRIDKTGIIITRRHCWQIWIYKPQKNSGRLQREDFQHFSYDSDCTLLKQENITRVINVPMYECLKEMHRL